MDRTVTLLTDFGHSDPYLAETRAALLRQWTRYPEQEAWPRIVDIAHDLAPGDVDGARWLLARTAPQFPEGTVHVAVVDPGVGTSRPAVAVQAFGHFFVAPGNGLLTFLAGRADVVVVRLDNPLYHAAPPGLPLSTTFHGRDVFAPAAAHLAMGVPLEQVGTRGDPNDLGEVQPVVTPTPEYLGRIVWIDRFGNALTDLPRSSNVGVELSGGGVVEVGGHRVRGPVTAYAEGGTDEPFWYWGSGATLEIALRSRSAAAVLGLRRGLVIRQATP
ncbi:MAG: SAM-dependent chlorinase/fluorinase [Candidatus Krumholzibacteriia bacterium]